MARNVVERTIGIAKRRWRALREPLEYSIKTQVLITYACCVLHNFIRIHDALWEQLPEGKELVNDYGDGELEGNIDGEGIHDQFQEGDDDGDSSGIDLEADLEVNANHNQEKATAKALQRAIRDKLWEDEQERRSRAAVCRRVARHRRRGGGRRMSSLEESAMIRISRVRVDERE